jgi:recombination protein RecT
MSSEAQDKAQQTLAKRGKGSNKALVVKDVLERAKGAIQNALPRHMSAERMVKIAYGAISRNPKLLDCDPLSLAKCVVEASEVGLEPSGVLGHAYLVPYRNGKTRKMEAQFQIGARGFIELALRSGRVNFVKAQIVYEGDEFDYEEGTSRKLMHRPKLRQPGDATAPICTYATVEFTNGAVDFVVCDLAEIDKAMQASKAKGFGPWKDHWPEMAKKTAVRRLAKYLPQSPQMQAAAVAEEYKEAGIETVDVDFEVEETPESEEENG